MKQDKHIAVVGAGLIGSLLSIYLVRRGYTVSVFERRPDLRLYSTDQGRSINMALSNRGIRALTELGLMDKMKDLAIPMHGRMMHDLEGRLTSLPYGKEGEYINSVSREHLNNMLLGEAEREGVSFYFEHACTEINLEKTTLRFHHRGGDSDAQPYDQIIGADGAFSAVRGTMQITDRYDYTQFYIEHGYKELTIPSDKGRELEKNALHIWPRESFMLIALPNPDGSFTCTLFFPYEGTQSFDALKTDAQIIDFFQQVFPDALPLLPNLLTEFAENPTSSLVTIKCFPWVKNNTLVIGDAAHAMVPFYGQGMNAGFEDCRILNELLDKHADHWPLAMEEFQQLRRPDTGAMAELGLDNFIEMRDHVADADFLLRKKIEAKLHSLYPDRWIPLYSMVTFMDTMRYSDAQIIGRRQKVIMDEVMSAPDIFESWENLDFEAIVNKLQF